MILQYPQTAVVSFGQNATTDENGDMHPGAQVAVSFPCRAEFFRGSGMISTEGGESVNYAWLIFSPVDTPFLPVGAKIIVRDAQEQIILSDTVRRYLKGPFNCRSWL